MSGLSRTSALADSTTTARPTSGYAVQVHPDGHTAPVHVGSRAFQLLCLLVERRGELVSQHAIMEAVWPNTNVEQNNLSVQVATLRRVAGRQRRPGQRRSERSWPRLPIRVTGQFSRGQGCRHGEAD